MNPARLERFQVPRRMCGSQFCQLRVGRPNQRRSALAADELAAPTPACRDKLRRADLGESLFGQLQLGDGVLALTASDGQCGVDQQTVSLAECRVRSRACDRESSTDREQLGSRRDGGQRDGAAGAHLSLGQPQDLNPVHAVQPRPGLRDQLPRLSVALLVQQHFNAAIKVRQAGMSNSGRAHCAIFSSSSRRAAAGSSATRWRI